MRSVSHISTEFCEWIVVNRYSFILHFHSSGCTKIQETRPPSPPPHSTDATSAVLGGPYNKPSYQPTDICTNIPTNQHSLGQSNLAQKTSPQISPQSVVITDSNKALPSSVWSVQTNNNLGSRVSEPSPRGGQKSKTQVIKLDLFFLLECIRVDILKKTCSTYLVIVCPFMTFSYYSFFIYCINRL